ncbi:MAG: phage tail assembly chaperone [Sphingomonadaceae bacterium]|nr:phage tail assembly chaperone [Sphingomonadaceae bacterium]
MSYAIGGLGWTPAAFWAATSHDLMAAAEWHQLQAELRRQKEEANDG